MIVGIGLDIVDVADLARRVERGHILKAFSPEERAYAEHHPKRRMEILAARWAAKEAFAKAVGTGLRMEWPLHEIEVFHKDGGQPALRLGRHVQSLIPQGSKLHLSLSHSRHFAGAVVVIECDHGAPKPG